MCRSAIISRSLAALWIALVAAGCKKDPVSPPTSGIQPTFSSIQTNVFAGCATPSCHSTFANRGNMILEHDSAYANLVGVPAFNDSAAHAGLLRVKPGDPDHSFLYVKISGQPPAAEGVRMPNSSFPLDAETISAIRTWIANGAKKD
jgi:hypothetical protein